MMQKIIPSIDFGRDHSDDEVVAIIEAIEDYLLRHGFGEEYQPTSEGLMCQDILGTLARS